MEGSYWGYTLLVLVAYCVFIYFSFIYSGLLGYLFEKKPYAFAWLGLLWTLCSGAALFTWSSQYDVPERGNVDWFQLGPSKNLFLFNIPIDNWWTYTLIILYQVTRGLVASMISKVFGAFLLTQVQNRQSKLPLSPTQARYIQFGQSCATVTSYYTSATDIFLALTQIDLTLVGMFSTIVFDSVAIQKFLKERVQAYSTEVQSHDVPATTTVTITAPVGAGAKARAGYLRL
jgi:hypothetical protein